MTCRVLSFLHFRCHGLSFGLFFNVTVCLFVQFFLSEPKHDIVHLCLFAQKTNHDMSCFGSLSLVSLDVTSVVVLGVSL